MAFVAGALARGTYHPAHFTPNRSLAVVVVANYRHADGRACVVTCRSAKR